MVALATSVQKKDTGKLSFSAGRARLVFLFEVTRFNRIISGNSRVSLSRFFLSQHSTHLFIYV